MMVLITNADANSPSLALWNEFLLAALMFFGKKTTVFLCNRDAMDSRSFPFGVSDEDCG